MPDQDVFTLPAEAEPAKRTRLAKKQEVETDAEAKADDTPEVEPPKGPQPPHPDARLIEGQWLLRRLGKTYIARPAVIDGKRASSSLYDLREHGAILDDATPLCDQPGRLEAAIVGGCRMDDVSLYDDTAIDQEIDRLRASGFDHMADLLREKHPRAEHAPYGPLDLGRVQASANLHKLGPKVTGENLREFLRRHANGDWGDRGKLSEVELDADKREFPGAFGPAALNAVSIERGFGLVWSTYSGAEIVDDPQWRDQRRLHVATILGGSPRTYVWAAPYDHVSTN